MNTREILERLCLAPAPSGYEKECAYTRRAMMEPLADETRLDRNGNVICTLRGTDEASPSPEMLRE